MRISSSSSSPSKSNSNSNSRSSSTSINYINDQTKSALVPKTMEEVWKDINDLHGHPSSTAPAGVILQDFFSRGPPPSAAVPSSRFAPSPPPPPTLLTLNSSTLPHNHFNPLIMHHHHHHHRYNPDISHDNAGGGKKRFPADSDRNHGGDRHHKRMIKNRESAARSRARKQAYTNELESEVAQLLEENARLKKQHEELCIIAATTAQNQKNKCLHRTSTAPF